MISVENLYWVLFENLLRPVGLDYWYYYPWGTKENLSRGEFKPFNSKRDLNHVFFHFDQEPLWSEQLGPYDIAPAACSHKWVKILANSEHSALKNKICKSRGFLDWYFFYHGFAALDWYRDVAYIDHNHPIKNAFLSFNHMFDNRSYRLALLARLLKKQIHQTGSISFHAKLSDVHAELQDANTRLTPVSQALIHSMMSQLSSLPWRLDDVLINGALSARFGHEEVRLCQSSLWHLVNETVFYESKLHLTEKIFKPIVTKRPFILVAAPGNLAYLRSYGFRTFDQWIDESYDQIQDPDQRLDAIATQIERFCNMSMDQLEQVRAQMDSVLCHNKQHFFGRFREIITEELVDNFDRCLRIWNNGRIDDRTLQPHPDLMSVKRLLLN